MSLPQPDQEKENEYKERHLLYIEWNLALQYCLLFLCMLFLTQCALELKLELFLVVPEKASAWKHQALLLTLCGHWLGMEWVASFPFPLKF